MERPEDEANVCTSDDALIDRHICGHLLERGERGVGDGAKVGVLAKPEVSLAKHPMVDASRSKPDSEVVETTRRHAGSGCERAVWVND